MQWKPDQCLGLPIPEKVMGKVRQILKLRNI
jgi:hypothetical protein